MWDGQAGLYDGRARAHHGREPARCDGVLEYARLARRPGRPGAPRRPDGALALFAEGELAVDGAGELPVWRQNLWPACDRRILLVLDQPGLVRKERDTIKPRGVPQDVGRAAQALQGVYLLEREPACHGGLRAHEH